MPRDLVNNHENLLRRGYSTPEKKYMNPDGTATSRVFKLREKDNGKLSVGIENLTTLEEFVGDTERFMVFRISNLDVINLGLQTFYDPPQFEHAVITGMNMEDEIIPALLAKKSIKVFPIAT